MSKMNKFAKKAAESEAWGRLLEFAKNQVEYQYECKLDENGEQILDKNGEAVKVPPNEDSYRYSEYVGWSEVVKALENMKV